MTANGTVTPREVADNLRAYLRALDSAQHDLVVKAISEVVLGEEYSDVAFFRELDRRIDAKDSWLRAWARERWGCDQASVIERLVYKK